MALPVLAVIAVVMFTSAKQDDGVITKREGMTIVMITHDRQYALKRASHILSFEKDFFFGKKEDYLGEKE